MSDPIDQLKAMAKAGCEHPHHIAASEAVDAIADVLGQPHMMSDAGRTIAIIIAGYATQLEPRDRWDWIDAVRTDARAQLTNIERHEKR